MTSLSLLLVVLAQMQLSAPAPEKAPECFAPGEVEQLTARVGQEVALEGVAARLVENKARTTRILSFSRRADAGVALFFPAGRAGGGLSRAELLALVGKPIRVRGILLNRSGRLQMEVTAAEQIRTLPLPPKLPASALAAQAE